MVKKSIVLLATMLLFSACNFSFDFSFGDEEEEPTQTETEVQIEPEVTEPEEEENVVGLTMFEATGEDYGTCDGGEWMCYMNGELFFEMKIPKETDIYDCEIMDYTTVPVKWIWDMENDVFFITPEYNFDAMDGCVKYEVKEIPEERATPWKIVVRDVDDMEELEAFVQEMYGEACTISGVDDEKNVQINTTDWDGGCVINYITVMKYNELSGKAYSFDVGQDTNFYLVGGEYPETFDELMIESFKLLY